LPRKKAGHVAGVFQDDPNGTNKNKHRNLPSWYFFDIWTPKKPTNTRPKKTETHTGGRVFDV